MWHLRTYNPRPSVHPSPGACAALALGSWMGSRLRGFLLQNWYMRIFEDEFPLPRGMLLAECPGREKCFPFASSGGLKTLDPHCPLLGGNDLLSVPLSDEISVGNLENNSYITRLGGSHMLSPSLCTHACRVSLHLASGSTLTHVPHGSRSCQTPVGGRLAGLLSQFALCREESCRESLDLYLASAVFLVL